MNVIGIATTAKILGQSPRTTTRQAEAGDIPVYGRLEGDSGAYLFDRAEIIRIRDERIAAERARLDELEQSAEIAS